MLLGSCRYNWPLSMKNMLPSHTEDPVVVAGTTVTVALVLLSILVVVTFDMPLR